VGRGPGRRRLHRLLHGDRRSRREHPGVSRCRREDERSRAGSRTRPDGYKLSWVLATVPKPFTFQAPFLIQDHTPREERIGKETRHPNGVTGVAGITVATDDVARLRGWWSPVLRQPGTEIERSDVGAAGVRFLAGPHALDFVAPKAASSPIEGWLKTRGPSPYAIALKTSGEKKGALDESTAGTRITLM